MLSLSGRVALVTGGAKRIGRAVALDLAKEGADLVIHYNRSASEAEAVAAEARRLGVRSVAVGADLNGAEKAAALFDEALKVFGTIDLIVNSASIFEESTLADVTPDEIHRNIDVNALAPLELSRRLAAHRKERGPQAGAPPASVVNFLDTRILDYDRNHLAYHLSKRMLFSLTRITASELAPEVRVNAVAPGLILPPEGKDASYTENLKGSNPMRSVGTVDQICAAVRFLVTNEFVTGQVIYVDGGRHMRGSFYGT